MQRPTILLVLGCCAALSSAEIIETTVHLDGFQTVPPTGSPAIGIATVIIDTETRDITVDGTFSGFLGTVFAGHIHGPADPGQSSQLVIHPLVLLPDPDRFSGSFSLDARLSSSQLSAVLDSRTYINLHSSEFRDGEIRGQIIVPAPGAAGLIALGGLFASRRRR